MMAKRTMTTTTTRQDRPEIERLKELVEIYGGRRERWPMEDRLAMERLVAEDAQAAAIVTQVQALDRLLDVAPLMSAGKLSQLTDRIVARAQEEGRWQGVRANQGVSANSVVADLRTASAARTGFDRGLRAMPSRAWQAQGWRLSAALTAGRRASVASAAMLAASLMIGVFIGFSFSTVDIASTAQVVADAGEDVLLQQLVTGGESGDALVEDML